VVTADLRASKVTCHVDVEAPREGRATTRVNWLVRQLKNAPPSARVEAFVAHARGSQAAELLSTVRENPTSLIVDPAKELRTFRIAATTNMGTKRGRGRGCFIDSVLTGVDTFYAEVLGSLRAWSAAPPKMRPAHPEPVDIDETVPDALVSTDFSSQDEPATPSADDRQRAGTPIDPPAPSVAAETVEPPRPSGPYSVDAEIMQGTAADADNATDPHNVEDRGNPQTTVASTNGWN
jgi:hypothetical protein